MGFGEEPALAETPQNPVQFSAQVFKHPESALKAVCRVRSGTPR